jgi:hypothetical protein
MDNYFDNKYNELLYVNCYAKKNIMCNSISKLKNGMCDKCYKDIKHNLSEKELFDNYISIKKDIIDKFKTLLNNCYNTVIQKNKVIEVLHVFDLIYHNVYFTLTNIKFTKTIINKVVYLINNDITIINETIDDIINNKKYNNKYNETYIDVVDFMINMHDYYESVDVETLTDNNLLIDYNNFMKGLYSVICSKYKNTNSLNKNINNEINEEENIQNDIQDDKLYQNLKSIQIDL